MTAVIGILNKNAVAIAADSAVTVSGHNGSKIYNTANKIFTLSKYHPVSIVIYNSANFIVTPWEIIIKIYRNQLKNKSFNDLEQYSQDFFKFLKQKDFFAQEDTIVQFSHTLIYGFLEDFVRRTYEEAMQGDENLILQSEENRILIIQKYLIEILDTNLEQIKNSEKLQDFEYLTKKKFNSIINEPLGLIVDDNYPELINSKIKNKFSSFLYHYIKSKEFFGQWTGLVFAGYGDKDIYPRVLSTKVAGVFDNTIRYYSEKTEEINDQNNGSIMPFAQRDVIDTLISGISPDIAENLFETIKKFMTGYNENLASLIESENQVLANNIRSLDLNRFCTEFMDAVDEVRQLKHIMPTVETVSILSKEDLAEMAESLIYLTYLKRRISSHEESVGGPVDVAIISKGDGFVWIKRKHYFEHKYNPQFNKNYFNL